MQLEFFDHWLKGKQNGVADSAPVKIYVMGLNQWREEKEWPLPGTEWRRYYLHSRGRANSAYGDGALSTETPGAEPPDSYLYNPLNPVQTMGGGLCCYPNSVPGGAFDQAAVEHRADVLVYSTEPLRRGSRSDRPDQADALRVVVGARHGLHRQAGGRADHAASRAT